MSKAPLILGADLTKLKATDEIVKTLTNHDLLNANDLGLQQVYCVSMIKNLKANQLIIAGLN